MRNAPGPDNGSFTVQTSEISFWNLCLSHDPLRNDLGPPSGHIFVRNITDADHVITEKEMVSSLHRPPARSVKRSHDRVSMGFCFGLVFYLQRGWVWDTQTHVLLGSIFLFYFICYYGSVSYFLSWSNWTEEPKTDSRPIKEDIFILSQTVTSCELYLITITFLSSGLQSPEIFAHRGVVTFHANAAFYAWRSPAGYTGNSLPVG